MTHFLLLPLQKKLSNEDFVIKSLISLIVSPIQSALVNRLRDKKGKGNLNEKTRQNTMTYSKNHNTFDFTSFLTI